MLQIKKIKMETNSKEIHAIDKRNNDNLYTPNTHFIIDKNLFHCIICYDISPNVYETTCCGTLVCNTCKPYLKNSNCPVCKINTDFKISKVAKRIICNSITECPLCDFTDKYDRIACHVFKQHKENIIKSPKIEEDKKLFNFLSVYFCISLEKKFFSHSHTLQLVSKEKDSVCFAGSILGFKNCKMVDHISKKSDSNDINEESKNNDIKNNLHQNESNLNDENLDDNLHKSAKIIEDLALNVSKSDKKVSESEEFKNLIMEKLIYFCSECEGYFCENCLEGKDIWIPVKVHDHPLNLSKRDNGWFCDGRSCPDGCFNQNSTTTGLARYRCESCDFDLCEKCLMYYMH